MADVELIIKIDEEMYKWVNDVNRLFGDYGTGDFIDLVKSGTLLPKGYGDLIDRDLLKNQFPIWIDNFSSHVVNNTISKAPTIIRANRLESEE